MLYSEVHVHQDLEWWRVTFWRGALEQAKKFLDVMCNAKNCSQIGSRSNVAFFWIFSKEFTNVIEIRIWYIHPPIIIGCQLMEYLINDW